MTFRPYFKSGLNRLEDLHPLLLPLSKGMARSLFDKSLKSIKISLPLHPSSIGRGSGEGKTECERNPDEIEMDHPVFGLTHRPELPASSLFISPWSQTRDTQKVYKVAILPFLIHSQENLDYLRDGIYDILASRITVEGRIDRHRPVSGGASPLRGEADASR